MGGCTKKWRFLLPFRLDIGAKNWSLQRETVKQLFACQGSNDPNGEHLVVVLSIHVGM